MAAKRKSKDAHVAVTHVAVWKLEISGYGAFLYVGTEAEAKDRAWAKVEWEGSRKAPKTTRHREVTVAEARIYVKHGPDTLDGAPYHGKDEV